LGWIEWGVVQLVRDVGKDVCDDELDDIRADDCD
jgi:hypothetical protein